MQGGGYTFLPKIVILMELRKKEIGGRRVGTEERDTAQAVVFNTQILKTK